MEENDEIVNALRVALDLAYNAGRYEAAFVIYTTIGSYGIDRCVGLSGCVGSYLEGRRKSFAES